MLTTHFLPHGHIIKEELVFLHHKYINKSKHTPCTFMQPRCPVAVLPTSIIIFQHGRRARKLRKMLTYIVFTRSQLWGSLCVRWDKIQFVKCRDKLNNSKVPRSGITNFGPYSDTQMLKVRLRGTRFVLWDRDQKIMGQDWI